MAFFPPEDFAVYEIMGIYIVKLGMPQKTAWRMHIALWTTKATKTHSEYVIFIAFLWQQWLHEHASMLLYVHCLGCHYSLRVKACNYWF
jgi:hypothetical protein